MDVYRLIQDVTDTIGQQKIIRQDRLDASLALSCNLFTNIASGDFSESNLCAFLDRSYIKRLTGTMIHLADIDIYLPLMFYGFLFLRTQGMATKAIKTKNTDILQTAFADMYRAVLPYSSDDDFFASPEWRMVRQDLVNLDDETLVHWAQDHGFTELPLFRTNVRKKIIGNQVAVQVTSPTDVTYIYQEVSASTPPKEGDLFHDKPKFSRWISIPGGILIYKNGGQIHDMRWIKPAVTFVIRQSDIGPTGKILLSLATQGGTKGFTVRIHGVDNGEPRVVTTMTRSLLCEIRLQRWVDCARVTIEANSPYAANIDKI